MLSFSIDTKIVQRLWKLNESISEKQTLITSFSKETLEAIHRYARISQIGASTRIENAVLTDAEVDWVDTILSKDARPTAFEAHRKIIENKLSKDRERSIEEVAGCRAMLHLIYEQAAELFPLTEASLCGLHRELLRFYPKAHHFLGRYKTQMNKVVETNHTTGTSRVVFDTAPPGTITETAMADLVAWYNQSIHTEPWTLAVASEFVFRFLAIHPFQDGNGRLGRALFLLAILQAPGKTVSSLARYMAIDRHIERHKEEYYLTLNRCSAGKFSQNPKRYDIQYFLLFMIQIVEESLNDIETYEKKHNSIQTLSPSALKVLDCFKDIPEIRLQTKEICEITRLPRRTIAHVLSTLLKAQLIQKYGKGAGVRYQLIF